MFYKTMSSIRILKSFILINGNVEPLITCYCTSRATRTSVRGHDRRGCHSVCIIHRSCSRHNSCGSNSSYSIDRCDTGYCC